MKTFTLLLAGFLGFASTTIAAETPRGSLIELHSCELYAGGCTVSAESTQGGRYMLRVWNFSSGRFNGCDLQGQQLAVLQSSPDNLATGSSQSGNAVVYLSEKTTTAQREALLAWLKSSQSDFHPAKLQTRIVPLGITRTENDYQFTAGDFISVKATSMKPCDMGGCGEALWYEPRSQSSLFTVAVNRTSQVNEPFLQLKWADSGKRSVFLARFGEPTPAKDVYVTLGELCGPKALF